MVFEEIFFETPHVYSSTREWSDYLRMNANTVGLKTFNAKKLYSKLIERYRLLLKLSETRTNDNNLKAAAQIKNLERKIGIVSDEIVTDRHNRAISSFPCTSEKVPN